MERSLRNHSLKRERALHCEIRDDATPNQSNAQTSTRVASDSTLTRTPEKNHPTNGRFCFFRCFIHAHVERCAPSRTDDGIINNDTD